MLYSLLFNVVFLILVAVCVYYTILYTQLGEDIAEIKIAVKQCGSGAKDTKTNTKKKKTKQ
jgi:hypothetical protein